MREDRAAGELTAARQALVAAEETLAARRRELEDFEATKDERRDSIYAAVMGRTVSREQLDMVTEGVARIDEEGVLKADNVVRAEGVLHEKEEASAAAQSALNLAIKNRMKIEEHRQQWVEQDRKEQERLEDIELEDFTGRKQDD